MAHVTTNDGVKLAYRDEGKGTPIVMLPGWSQSAALFKHQFEKLSSEHRVIGYDHRGHGESDKPDHGYRMGRLAKDLDDVLTALGLSDVILMGHSMGCSVIWGYLDLFGYDRVKKLVLIDQPAVVLATPIMSQKERDELGAIIDAEGLMGLYAGLVGDDWQSVTEGFVGSMLTKTIAPELKGWIMEENLKFPRKQAAELLIHHASTDWRDMIRRISVPTLVLGGKASHVPPDSQVWIHEHIPGSRLEIFEAEEGGSHFMFLESPEKFNRVVREFVGE